MTSGVKLKFESVYCNPLYYEVAFSFRDIPKEVDVIEECIAQYSRIPVGRVLEFACGCAPHLDELLKRGYAYVGVDLSEPMLAYARERAARVKSRHKVKLVRADIASVELEEPVDFACTMLGSLYVRSTEELVQHFERAAACIRPGGLYLLDWCIDFDPHVGTSETWECERDGVHCRTTCLTNHVNRMEQVIEEHITIEVDDHGRKVTLVEKTLRRVMYPQEFLGFIGGHGDFEFVGWWNDWDLSEPLEGTESVNRPIAVIRRG